MNKSELIKSLAEENNMLIGEATTVVNTFIEVIKASLGNGDRVEIRGFGSFKIKSYCGYTGHNPKSGENVIVKPKQLPCFRVSKAFSWYVNH